MTGTIVSSALSAVTGFFGGIQTYLIVGAVTALVAGSAGAYAGYRWELGTYETLVASVQKSATVATQKVAAVDAAQSTVNTNAAVHEDQAQFAIQAPHLILKTEIAHETPTLPACPGLSVYLARRLRAASANTDLEHVALAPGQSDSDCSDVTDVEVAGWFNDYATAAQRNTQQLTDLQAWVRDNHAAQESVK
jgi:hypothetical protein